MHTSAFPISVREVIAANCESSWSSAAGGADVTHQSYRKLSSKDDGAHMSHSHWPKTKVQPPGIEPGSKPWEGSIMPLDHGCLVMPG